MHLPCAKVLCALFVAAGLVAAQQGDEGQKSKEAPKSPTLEDLLAKAAKDNPDVRVAESKLRETEAELNRARLMVTQKVVKAYHEIAAHKMLVAQAQASLERALKLGASQAISQEELSVIQQAAQQAKANLAKAESEMPFLLGSQSTSISWLIEVRDYSYHADVASALRVGKLTSVPIAGPMADRIRETLDTPIKLDLQNVQLRDLLEHLRDHAKGVNIQYAAKMGEESPITVRFREPVPFGAVAQWFEDNFNARFVVRDYGIVIVDPKTIPPGAMPLHDFWKSEKGKKAAEGPKN